MKGWRDVTLSDISMAIDYGYTASSSHINIGPKFLRITDIARSNIIDWNSVPFCSISQEDNEKYKLYSGDIVIARTGASTGATYTIKDTDPKDLVFASYLIRYRINPEIADANLVGKFLRSKNWNEYVSGVVGGSAQPGANAKVLGAYSFLLPPLSEQRAIAAVLNSLDDKIDLLHRQNATLEAMAEALFRKWFVVEAKEEWEEKTIGDVVEIKGGSTPSTKNPDYWDGNISWTSPKDLTGEKSIFMFSTERTISADGLAQISSGLLPKGTLLLSSRAPIGYLAIADIELAINQGYIAILNNSYISSYYMYLWCKYNMEGIKAAGNGSVFQEISKSVFRQLPFLLPPKDILSNFNSIIESYFQKIHSNQTQINILKKLRDTLLPKLMSGEVRVDS